MDFFDHQERAKSKTNRLIFLFGLAVALTIVTVYFCLAGFFTCSYFFVKPFHSAARSGWFGNLIVRFGADGWWSWELLGWVATVVLFVLWVGTWFKLRQLSGGGAAVAAMLGGRLLNLNTTDPDEQRLRNVVEEMALAAGARIPDVYVLEDEHGINAFAAGTGPSDAVIGITFGAVKLLNRDELQGVVAHEFSHILNGDIRLNLRLIAWLHGLLGLVVLGRIFTLNFGRADRDRSPSDRLPGEALPLFRPAYWPAFVLGCSCVVAGSIGAFFARLIKSAVSRQREYLADAAAVQFTRNPDGIAGALMKIGGVQLRSTLLSARAEEASHMYFAEGMPARWFGLTSTHPPLVERIRRMRPQFDGRFPAISMERVLRESKVAALYREQGDGKPVDFRKLAAVIGPVAAAEEMLFVKAARESPPAASEPVAGILPGAIGFSPMHLEYAALLLGALPESLRAATSQPFSAVALVYGMVCSKDPEVRARQMVDIAETAEPGIVSEMARLMPSIETLDARAFLPLTDLGLPALRRLSDLQYETFRDNLRSLVEDDRQIDLFEYMLERMIVRHLDPHFRRVKRPIAHYYALKPLIADCAILLSGIAWMGHDNEEEARIAFEHGAAALGAGSGLQMAPFAECNLPQIDAALARTALSAPRVKQQILHALAFAVATDGQVNRREAELLRAIADAFGSPVPPFLCAPQGRTPSVPGAQASFSPRS